MKKTEKTEQFVRGLNENTEKVCMYGTKKEFMATNRTITIPKNTVLSTAPVRITHNELHYELIIAIGNDHTATFTISESALRALNRLEPEVNIS